MLGGLGLEQSSEGENVTTKSSDFQSLRQARIVFDIVMKMPEGVGSELRAHEERLDNAIVKYINAWSLIEFASMFHEACHDNPKGIAMLGALAKLARDPKQKYKAIVRNQWNIWQRNLGDYKSKAGFARDMREQFPDLKSQPVIEGWCRAWERESKSSPS
jgi:hypothetical protein